DIKPENVLLDRKGRVRIADFGLAKLQRDAAPGTAMRTRRVMGAPQYMAPEQIRDPGSVDHRTDIFAVGVVFYEMLTGQLPVGRFQLPSELGDGGAALDDIVLRALEANRDRRFQAASEICVALSEIDADGRATRIETFSAPNRWAVWAGGGLAAVGAGALAWQLGRTTPESGEHASESQSNETAASPLQETVKPTNSRARWPAAELGILDASVAGVLGLDWSELRQAPVIKKLGEVLPVRGEHTEHCNESILNHTNKVLLGIAADGKPVDLVVHADWDLDALDACLGATDRALAERDQEVDFTWKSEAFGPHRRIAVTLDDETFSVTVGKLGPRVVATFRPVTVEQLDAMLAGKTIATPLAQRVLSTLDLSAPVWVFAEPAPGLLPLGMVSVHGVVDLWNKLSIDATAEFADEAAATSAKVLIESYANVIASLPNVAVDPKIIVTQTNRRVRARVDMAMPELDDPRLKIKLTGDAPASLKIER
ncbi:MAG: protein kinase, partial [Nannocystaceae bacterium]|nr:protein kinase [Nannocystaceae bacterium]